MISNLTSLLSIHPSLHVYLFIPVCAYRDGHEQQDLHHQATDDAQPKSLFVFTDKTHSISHSKTTGTYELTTNSGQEKGFFFIYHLMYRPADLQDEGYEVGRGDADDIVGTKIDPSTNLLPSTASSHPCTSQQNILSLLQTQACL